MNKYIYSAVVGIIIILIIALGIAIKKIEKLNGDSGKVIRDTTIVVKYDTLKIIKPKYITQTVIDSVFVPIKDTLRINDTLYQVLPKTQRYYVKDSVYKAWISGYKPQLDSIQVYPKTIIQTINNTITRKPSKFGIGISAGYGVTVNKQPIFVPFIGVSLNYNLVRF
jgi:hypothetical protein